VKETLWKDRSAAPLQNHCQLKSGWPYNKTAITHNA
jgi:hypothetical protein